MKNDKDFQGNFQFTNANRCKSLIDNGCIEEDWGKGAMATKYKDSNRKRRPKAPKIDWILIFTAITALVALISYFESKNDHRNINFAWVTLEDAVDSLSTSDSKVQYIYEFYGPLPSYYEGVALIAHYNNLDEYDKTIYNISIHIKDIVEDYTPHLSTYYSEGNLNVMAIGVYNSSWSETGKVQVSYQSFGPFQDDYNNFEMPDSLSVKFPQNMRTVWEFESIQPGETNELLLCPLENLVVNYQGNGEGKVFLLKFNVSIQQSNWYTTFDLPCIIHNGKVEQFPWPQGGGAPLTCGVWIDTSKENVEKLYNVRQVLPGNQAIDIPIFFIPSMSCTMTIQVELQMDDGHIIKVPPLKNVHIFVPYYEGDYYQYLHNGELIDWEVLEGEYAILNDIEEYYIGFPFQTICSDD